MTRRTWMVAALACVLTTPSWAAPSASPPLAETVTGAGVLQGVVTGEQHGLTLHRVSVTLRSETQPFVETRSTDREGVFRFDDVPPGLYSLEAKRTGYEDRVLAPILVLPGRELIEQVSLEPSVAERIERPPVQS